MKMPRYLAVLQIAALVVGAGAESALGQAPKSQGRGDRAADRGIALYNDGDYHAAALALDSALAAGVSKYPREQIYTILGNTLNELDRFDDAIGAHRKAIAINARYHEAWVNLGIVYRLQGDYEQAETCYLKALALAPNYPELHASLGALYIFKDEPTKAILSLKRAIALNRQLPVAHANLAIASAMNGEFEEAEASLGRAIALGYKNGPTVQGRIDELKGTSRSPRPQ